MNYSDRKIKEINQHSLNEIRRFYASNKFYYLLKKFSNKQILSHKNDVVDILKREKKIPKRGYNIKLNYLNCPANNTLGKLSLIKRTK